MPDTRFFIIGTQRGGTTLLRMMLNTHSKIAIPPESHFLIPLLKKFPYDTLLNINNIDEAIDIIRSHPRFKTWSITNQDIDKLKRRIKYPLPLSKFINELFEVQISLTGKPIWGEKTPEYIDIIPKIAKLFPEAFFIVLTRDGRDVSLSLKNRGWQGMSVYQRANYWRNCITKVEYLKSHPNMIFIRYEDLVLNTKGVLIDLCRLLNVPFEEKMLRFFLYAEDNITEKEKEIGVHRKLSRKPNEGDIGRWKEKATKFEVWAFESIAYKELRKSGYKLEYFSPSNVLHQFCKLVYFGIGNFLSAVDLLFHRALPTNIQRKLRESRMFNVVKSKIKSV